MVFIGPLSFGRNNYNSTEKSARTTAEISTKVELFLTHPVLRLTDLNRLRLLLASLCSDTNDTCHKHLCFCPDCCDVRATSSAADVPDDMFDVICT